MFAGLVLQVLKQVLFVVQSSLTLPLLMLVEFPKGGQLDSQSL